MKPYQKLTKCQRDLFLDCIDNTRKHTKLSLIQPGLALEMAGQQYQSLYRSNPDRYYLDVLRAAAMDGAHEAAGTYNPVSAASFETFLRRVVGRRILDAWRKHVPVGTVRKRSAATAWDNDPWLEPMHLADPGGSGVLDDAEDRQNARIYHGSLLDSSDLGEGGLAGEACCSRVVSALSQRERRIVELLERQVTHEGIALELGSGATVDSVGNEIDRMRGRLLRSGDISELRGEGHSVRRGIPRPGRAMASEELTLPPEFCWPSAEGSLVILTSCMALQHGAGAGLLVLDGDQVHRWSRYYEGVRVGAGLLMAIQEALCWSGERAHGRGVHILTTGLQAAEALTQSWNTGLSGELVASVRTQLRGLKLVAMRRGDLGITVSYAKGERSDHADEREADRRVRGLAAMALGTRRSRAWSSAPVPVATPWEAPHLGRFGSDYSEEQGIASSLLSEPTRGTTRFIQAHSETTGKPDEDTVGALQEIGDILVDLGPSNPNVCIMTRNRFAVDALTSTSESVSDGELLGDIRSKLSYLPNVEVVYSRAS